MSDDEFDNFNLSGIDNDAKAYLPPVRPSQRREAGKLEPLIKRALAANPMLDTAAVRNILERNRRSGKMPATATFNREFARICGEVRNGVRHGQSSKKPARSSKPKAMPESIPVTQVSPVGAIATDHMVHPKADRSTVTSSHPLAIYAGSFGGRVFKSGPMLRDFFSAVEKSSDDATLKSLARRAANDVASRVRLPDLHPKDQSIFEAALALP